jgi:hypothetical protein
MRALRIASTRSDGLWRRIAIVFVAMSAPVSAQWLNVNQPGIPRLADGKPDMSAPAPRQGDGKPDLTGIWLPRNFVTDITPEDAQPWAAEIAKQKAATLGIDSFSVLCLPPGPMIGIGGMVKVVQTPRVAVMLYEELNLFRQVHLDGRELPNDPNPSWQGYSVGRWEGDVLVVETIGFNDRSLMLVYPHTERIRVTERYHRLDFGHMKLNWTIDDPDVFKRAWTMSADLLLQPDTELLEYVCNENEKFRQRKTVN